MKCKHFFFCSYIISGVLHKYNNKYFYFLYYCDNILIFYVHILIIHFSEIYSIFCPFLHIFTAGYTKSPTLLMYNDGAIHNPGGLSTFSICG